MQITDIKDLVKGTLVEGKRRSPLWPSVRKKHLRNNPLCACCSSKKKLEVHHIIPFHVDSSEELNPENLITLCQNGRYGFRSCHLLVGHEGRWRTFNPQVDEDCKKIRAFFDAKI